MELKPIEIQQIYERVSEQIIALIQGGTWQVGDRLPPERQLAAQLNVSRPTVREAIAALNTVGVLETKPGSGSYVARGSHEAIRGIKSSSQTFVRSEPDGSENSLLGIETFHRDVSPVALLEARELLEPGMCALAAKRYRPSEELKDCLEVMSRELDPRNHIHRGLWSDADRIFHREFAVMADNPILLRLGDFVASVMDQPLWRNLRDETLTEDPSRFREYETQHRRILDAVSEGDVELSTHMARAHVRTVRRHMGLS